MGQEGEKEGKQWNRGGGKGNGEGRAGLSGPPEFVKPYRSRTDKYNAMNHYLITTKLQREIMEGWMEGKRGRGRPR